MQLAWSNNILDSIAGGGTLLYNKICSVFHSNHGRVAKSADARDLKSRVPHGTCGFKSRLGHYDHLVTSFLTKSSAVSTTFV